jgi:hypothetical protein
MARSILQILSQIRNGALEHEATSDLADVVRGVNNTGKGGELTIKIRIKPTGPADATLFVDGEVIKKIPTPERELSIFFPTQDGSLTKTDPNQMPLGLRPVGSSSDSPPAGSKVDTTTGEVLTS